MRTNNRWIPRVAVAAVLAAPVTAPTAPPTPVPIPGVERVEVRLAQYDVVVRDKSGRLIHGLGAENFSVVEDGVALEVVAADEWGAESTAPRPQDPVPEGSGPPVEGETDKPTREPDRRSIVIVFDALGDSTALRMNQAKRAAQKFVRAHVGAEDLVAVYQMDLTLRPVSGIGSNAEEIARAIDRVVWMPASSIQDDIADSILGYTSTGNNPRMQERLTGMATVAHSQIDWQREHVYDLLDNLNPVFQGLPGRRILVLASPGFSMTTTGDVQLQTGGFTPKFKTLVRGLSKLGVSVYTLDIGSDLTMGDAGTAIDWRAAAGKMGMDENVLSDLGLDRTGGSASAASRRQFLGVLAGETGGRMLTSTDLNRDFETIQEESTQFYRVACRVKVTDGVGRYRRTTIRVNLPGATVSTRRGRYSDVTPLDRTPTERATLAETLDTYRPVAARGVAFPLPTADPRKVPVAVVLEALGPIGLTTAPDGSGAIDVEFRLVARAAGEVVDRYERSFTAKVRQAGVASLQRALRVEGRLALVPGIYEIQGTVRLLDPPQLASWTSTVAVPPPPKDAAIAFAGAFLVPDDIPAAPLISRPEMPAESDPLVLKSGARVLPPAVNDFDAGRPLLALFWLRGVPTEDGKPKLDLELRIADADGKLVEASTQLALFAPEPLGGFKALARLEVGLLPPGSYELRLEARSTAADTPSSARRTLSFALHAPEAPTATAVPGASSSSAP